MRWVYPLYIWRNNNSNGMGGVNVLDNIVVFYIFFTIVFTLGFYLNGFSFKNLGNLLKNYSEKGNLK